jgi:hypothetical protein
MKNKKELQLTTESQRFYMNKLKISFDPSTTKEDASNRISAFLEKRDNTKAKRARRKILKENFLKKETLEFKKSEKLKLAKIEIKRLNSINTSNLKPKTILRKKAITS